MYALIARTVRRIVFIDRAELGYPNVATGIGHDAVGCCTRMIAIFLDAPGLFGLRTPNRSAGLDKPDVAIGSDRDVLRPEVKVGIWKSLMAFVLGSNRPIALRAYSVNQRSPSEGS